MRKRWRWVVVGLAVALAALTGFALLPTRWKGFTRQDHGRVCEGMTLAEVETALGRPLNDYRTGETEEDPQDPGIKTDLLVGDTFSPKVMCPCWESNTGDVVVGFDASGHANFALFRPMRRVSDNPFVNLLWRFKRQWRRWFP